jgi:hypothetical protein
MPNYDVQKEVRSATIHPGAVVVHTDYVIMSGGSLISRSPTHEVYYIGAPGVEIDNQGKLIIRGGFAEDSIVQIEVGGKILVAHAEAPVTHIGIPPLFDWSTEGLAYKLEPQNDPLITVVSVFRMNDDGTLETLPVTRIAQKTLRACVIPQEIKALLREALGE